MPIHWREDPRGRWPVIVYEDPYTVEELTAAIDASLAHAITSAPRVRMLFDRRTSSPPTLDFVRAGLALWYGRAERMRGARIAVVTSEDPQMAGMVRMAQATAQARALPMTFEAFATWAAAEQWLDEAVPGGPRPGISATDVLLVEDNPADVRLLTEAFAESNIPHHLHVARDGAEAVAFVRREGTFAAAPQPDLILLDLNLPLRDGRQVLAELKTDPILRVIPVVILSTSTAEGDLRRAYELHANCYIKKPVDFTGFLDVVASIERFWIGVASLPTPLAG